MIRLAAIAPKPPDPPLRAVTLIQVGEMQTLISRAQGRPILLHGAGPFPDLSSRTERPV